MDYSYFVTPEGDGTFALRHGHHEGYSTVVASGRTIADLQALAEAANVGRRAIEAKTFRARLARGLLGA